MTHAVAGTDDIGYGCSFDQGLSDSQSIANADNFNVSLNLRLEPRSHQPLTLHVIFKVLHHSSLRQYQVLDGFPRTLDTIQECPTLGMYILL